MATWNDIRGWLQQALGATDSDEGMRVLIPRPSGEAMPVMVFAPSDEAPGSIRVMTRLFAVSECADRNAAGRLVDQGSFFEREGYYCFRVTIAIPAVTTSGLVGALRHFAGSAGDVARRLTRRAPVAESSCFAAYAD